MKKMSDGSIFPTAEDWEKLKRIEKDFVQTMRNEGLTYIECEYVLDGCKTLLKTTLVGKFLDQ